MKISGNSPLISCEPINPLCQSVTPAVCFTANNDVWGEIAPFCEDILLQRKLKTKKEFVDKLEEKIAKEGSSLKPLSKLLKKIILDQQNETIKKAMVKPTGYFQRLFSKEGWEEWAERGSSLGRLVSYFTHYLSCNSGDQARAIARLDVAMVAEANDQAIMVLQELGYSLANLLKKVDSSLTFPGAKAETTPAESKDESEASTQNEDLWTFFLVGEEGQEHPLAEIIIPTFVMQNATSSILQSVPRKIPNLAEILVRLQQRLKTFENGLALGIEYFNFEPEELSVAKTREFIETEKNYRNLCRSSIKSYQRLDKQVAAKLAELDQPPQEDKDSVFDVKVKNFRSVGSRYKREMKELENEIEESKKRTEVLKGFAQETTSDELWREIFKKIKDNIPFYQLKIENLKQGIERIASLTVNDFYQPPQPEGLSLPPELKYY